MDVPSFTLLDGTPQAKGTANIVGGFVKIAQGVMQPQYGSLIISCATLNFSGTYAPKINGAFSGTCDLLTVNGTLKLNAGSTLQVSVVGNLGTKNTEDWMIIASTGGQINNFTTTNNNATGLGGGPNVPRAGSYELTW